MKNMINKLLALAMIAGAFVALPAARVAASDVKTSVCNGVVAAGGACTESGAGTTVNDIIATVVDVLSVIVGVVAVIMIIVGGFKYITSSGDSSNIQSAKNTIMYAIVGLVIVAMAQAITGFVLDRTT